jgi:DNA-binding IscR family transcriptional regulator
MRSILGKRARARTKASRFDQEGIVLTKKGKYGLKAMVHLAGLAPGATAQVVEIAKTNSISKKFLDHILTELRNAGFVCSKRAGAAATR